MNQISLLPLIRNLGQRTQEFLSHKYEFLGLGPGQIKTLTQIIASPGINQSQLKRQLNLDKSTISRSVRNLVKAGYVEKRAYRNDQKSKALWATKLATEFAQQMNSIVKNAESVIIGNLTEEEKQVLDRALYESRMHYVQASQAGG